MKCVLFNTMIAALSVGLGFSAKANASPGTNPAFLYQQNTIRDAVSAGNALNMFNTCCNRIKMANIAQTVNVLQAMILTDAEKIVLTPTYHVFEMYKHHQGATLLPHRLDCRPYELDGQSIDAISVSASISSKNTLLITLCHLDHEQTTSLVCDLPGVEIKQVSARILTAETLNAHNTFDQPDRVKPVDFQGINTSNNQLEITLPPHSVISIEITPQPKEN